MWREVFFTTRPRGLEVSCVNRIRNEFLKFSEWVQTVQRGVEVCMWTKSRATSIPVSTRLNSFLPILVWNTSDSTVMRFPVTSPQRPNIHLVHRSFISFISFAPSYHYPGDLLWNARLKQWPSSLYLRNSKRRKAEMLCCEYKWFS